MDFTRIRASIIPWRGQSQTQQDQQHQQQQQQTVPDLEQQALPQTTDLQEETRNNLRLFSPSRPAMANRFSLRSSWATSWGRGQRPESGHVPNGVVSSDDDEEDSNHNDDDGPKSPMSVPAQHNRFRLPSLSRYSSSRTTRTRDQQPQHPLQAQQYPEFDPEREGQIQGQNQEFYGEPPQLQQQEQEQEQRRSRPLSQRFPILTRPLAVRTSRPTEEVTRQGAGSRTRFGGSDPAELHLAGLADPGRRRERQRQRHRREQQQRQRRRGGTRKSPRPKRFLFCFPWVKSRRARGLILRCFVSGLFLICMLTVYLSLSITKNINTSAFTILLILLILLTTIFFCHGLIRLCMLLVGQRGRKREEVSERERRRNMTNVNISGGYAIPAQPIRVVLARDEEAAGIESETTKMTPPAYGLWRESVRVDPDRIYWQRAETPKLPTSAPNTHNNPDEAQQQQQQQQQQQHRPPSYISDDGIDYVIEARPRSIAPPPPPTLSSSSVYSQQQFPSSLSSSASANMVGTPMTSVSYLVGELNGGGSHSHNGNRETERDRDRDRERERDIPPLPTLLHPALRPGFGHTPGGWNMV